MVTTQGWLKSTFLRFASSKATNISKKQIVTFRGYQDSPSRKLDSSVCTKDQVDTMNSEASILHLELPGR